MLLIYERLKFFLNSYLALSGTECLDYTYQSFVDYLGQTEYGSTGGFRQWTYQTCSEFGWYQTSDQPDHPYGSKFPLEFSIKVSEFFKYILLKWMQYAVDKIQV